MRRTCNTEINARQRSEGGNRLAVFFNKYYVLKYEDGNSYRNVGKYLIYRICVI